MASPSYKNVDRRKTSSGDIEVILCKIGLHKWVTWQFREEGKNTTWKVTLRKCLRCDKKEELGESPFRLAHIDFFMDTSDCYYHKDLTNEQFERRLEEIG